MNSTMTGDVHSSFLVASESAIQFKIQIFPNPVSDFITISGIENSSSVQIFNMTGQLVKEKTLDRKINVSELTSGIYLLIVKTKDAQPHEFKFVKK